MKLLPVAKLYRGCAPHERQKRKAWEHSRRIRPRAPKALRANIVQYRRCVTGPRCRLDSCPDAGPGAGLP